MTPVGYIGAAICIAGWTYMLIAGLRGISMWNPRHWTHPQLIIIAISIANTGYAYVDAGAGDPPTICMVIAVLCLPAFILARPRARDDTNT